MVGRLYFRLFFASFFLFCACTSTSTGGQEALIWRLNNRGPISLSTENPFLAANLFVSRLAEQSQVIYGFIEYRGVPPAIEVVSDYFKEPVVHFYYPESREFFELERFENAWVVNGPERIPPAIQDHVAELTGMLRGTPILRVHSHPELLIQGGEQAFARPGDEAFRTASSTSHGFVPKQPVTANAPPTVQGVPLTGAGYRLQQPPIEPQQSKEELHIQQEIARLQNNPAAQGAEITPQGDLVHYVIYPGETLSIIARWYTHDRANSGRIARINDLKNPDHLEIGDSIIVPSYLLKTQSRYSETDLNQLLSISSH